MDLMVTTLEGTNAEYDESGMKSLLPNPLWMIQPENQLLGGAIRAKPADPAPGIAPGPIPIEPPPPMTAAEMNYSALCLNHYQVRVAAHSRANGNVQRHRAAKTIIKMTFINRTQALGDKTAHVLLTNDRVTNQPNPCISAGDLLPNFYDGFTTGTVYSTTLQRWRGQRHSISRAMWTNFSKNIYLGGQSHVPN